MAGSSACAAMVLMVGAMAVSEPVSASPSTSPVLGCAVEVEAKLSPGTPVMLRFTLTNTSRSNWNLLRWNTPFEGAWLAPFVTVTRDGQALEYQGAQVKRAEPQPEQYLLLAAGAAETAEVDLAQVFDLSRTGRYRVQPRLQFSDHVQATQAPPLRPRREHVLLGVTCPAVQFRIVPADPAPGR